MKTFHLHPMDPNRSALVLLFLLVSCASHNSPVRSINLTAPQTAYSIPTIIAVEKGIFREMGLDVKVNYVSTGKVATDDLLAGKANFANIVETNVAFAGYQNPSIAVLCNIEKVYDAAIVARKDKGINSESDLRGKKLGVVLATTSQIFADRMLEKNHIIPDSIHLVNLLPPAMQSAIIEGSSVEAISLWQPYVYNVQKTLGDKAITFTERNIFTGYMNLAANKDFLTQNPDVAAKMLKAYIEAEEFIQKNKSESIAIIARVLKLDQQTVEAIWNQYEFKISLDKELVDATVTEGAWIKKTQTPFISKPLPDYGKFFDAKPLADLDQNRVHGIAQTH